MIGEGHDQRLPLAAPRDLRALAMWSLGYCATGPLPPRALGSALRALLRLNRGRAMRKARRLAPRMAEVLSPYLPDADFGAYSRVYYEAKLEERMGLWWSLHGRAWPLTIEVEGRRHIDAALEAGRGAVLWGMELGGVMTRKCALRQLGLPLVHLRGSLHGAPDPPTRFGLRTAARIQCRAEDIYLEDCVMVGPSAPPGGLRRLRPHLEANRCVWINGEGEVGRTLLPVRLLGLERGLPTGAPSLAAKSGTPLIPTRFARLGPRSYRLVFEAPIPRDGLTGDGAASERSRDERSWIAGAVERFASLVEGAVLEHPPDWDWAAHWLQDAVASRSRSPR